VIRKSKTMSIHWVRYEPTFYYDDFLRTISAEPEIDLMVHYDVPELGHYPWKRPLRQGYPSRVRPSKSRFDSHLLRQALRDREAFFLMAGWWTPTMVALINELMLLRRPFAVFTDTPVVSGRRGGIVQSARKRWLSLVFKRASAVLATGRPGVEALVQMGCPPHRTVNLPWFVELPADDEVRESWRARKANEVIFFSCGRLVAQKGYDILLRAFAQANAEATVTARLVIAGTGPEEDALRDLAAGLGIADLVEFSGWLEQDQVCSWLRRAHVFVLSSVAHDAFPVSVLEAMAAGLPIAGSDVSGSVVDRVSHGKNGFIHHAGAVDQLATHLRAFLSQPALIESMGAEARRTAQEWPTSRGVEIIKTVVRRALNGSEDR